MKRQWKQYLALMLAFVLGLTSGLGGGGFSFVNLNPATAFEAPAVEASEDVSAEEPDAEETEEIEVEEEAIEDEVSSEEDFEETEAEEVEEESNEDLVDAEEAAAEESVEEATEETTEQDVEDETGNDSDILEDQSISDAITEDEALSDEADAPNEAEEVEETEVVEGETVEDEADTLDDSGAKGPVVEVPAQGNIKVGSKDVAVNGLQSGVSVSGYKFETTTSGALKYVKGGVKYTDGAVVSGLEASGWYLPLKFSKLPTGDTSSGGGVIKSYARVRVGLIPSHSGGTDETMSLSFLDANLTKILRVTNKDEQKLVVQWTFNTGTFNTGTGVANWDTADLVHEDVYDLSGLKLGYETDEKLVTLTASKETADLGTYKASELQKDISIVDGAGEDKAIGGTLYYKTEYKTFSNTESEKSGYYLALNAKANTSITNNDLTYIGIGIYSKDRLETGNPNLRKLTWVSAETGDDYLLRIPDMKNTKLRVVGISSGTPSSEHIEDSALDIKYEAFYDLSKLELAYYTGTTEVPENPNKEITAATIDSFARVDGENAPVFVGDEVTFKISGTIAGGNVDDETLSKRPQLTISFDNADGAASDVFVKGSYRVEDLAIRGTRWSGTFKVATKKATQAKNAQVEITKAEFSQTGFDTFSDTTSKAGGTLASHSVKSEAIWVLSKTLVGSVTLGTPVHLGSAYSPTSTVNFLGSGEVVDETSTYVEATYDDSSYTNKYSNVLEFYWYLKDGGGRDYKYYTYKLADESGSTVSRLVLPTIENEGILTGEVKVKGYYWPGATSTLVSAIAETSEENGAYTSPVISNLVTNGTVAETMDWSEKDSNTWTVVNYGEGKEFDVPLTGMYHKGSQYSDGTNVGNPFGVNEDGSNTGTYVTAEFTPVDDYTTTNKVVAFEWTWKNPDTKTATGSTLKNWTYQTLNGSNKITSKFLVPNIPAAGNGKASVSVRARLWLYESTITPTDSNNHVVVGQIVDNQNYSDDKLATMDGMSAMSGWSSAKAVKDLVVVDQNALTKISINDTLTSEIPTVGQTVKWGNATNPPVNQTPAGAKGGITWSVTSSDEKIATVSMDSTTLVTEVTGVSEGDVKITYTATQNGESFTDSKSITIGANTFTVVPDGDSMAPVEGVVGEQHVLFTHQGAGTIDLDSIYKNPTDGTVAKNNKLVISRNGEEFNETEMKSFDFKYDYPSGSAGEEARKLYSLNGSKLTVLDGKFGVTTFTVQVTCGAYGKTGVEPLYLYIEEAMPTTLTIEPGSFTVSKSDKETTSEPSVYVGTGLDLTAKWTVDEAHSDWIDNDGVHTVKTQTSTAIKNAGGYSSTKLNLTSATHYKGGETVNVTFSCTQNFKDGSNSAPITASKAFPIYIKDGEVTLEGSKIVETSKTKGKVVKAVSGTTSEDTVLMSMGDKTGRVLTASALPEGLSSNVTWAWKASEDGIVKFSETATAATTITSLKAGTTTITATPNNDSQKAASFKVQVFDAPAGFAIDVQSTAGGSIVNSKKANAILGNTYNIGFATAAGGTLLDKIDGYDVAVAISDSTQGTGTSAFEPLEISESVSKTGRGTIKASKFTSDPVTFRYTLSMTNENGEAEVDSVSDSITVVVDNVALAAGDPISFKPGKFSVEPGESDTIAAVAASASASAVTGVTYKWEIVDYNADHSKLAQETYTKAAEFAKIVNDDDKESVTVRGLKASSLDVDLLVNYTQPRSDGTTTKGKAWTTITVASSSMEASDLKVYVDGVNSEEYNGIGYLANDTSKEMRITSAVLPSTVNSKDVEWGLDSVDYVKIAESTGDGSSYKGTSITLKPTGTQASSPVTLTAKTTASGTPIYKTLKIYVRPVSLESVEFVTVNSADNTKSVISSESVSSGGSIVVQALPYPRSAGCDASKTEWTRYKNKETSDSTAGSGYISVAPFVDTTTGESSATITGSTAGTEYVGVKMYDAAGNSVTSTSRLEIKVVSGDVPFASITLAGETSTASVAKTAKETIKVADELTLTAGFTPAGASAKNLTWKLVEGSNRYDSGVAGTYAKMDVAADGKSAKI
ncbi:MAG: hypothetical protein IJ679_11135, partial [Lachnospiraceae bacterium]|nr:hypothetical protein [Lachnospiraceae bacterium]